MSKFRKWRRSTRGYSQRGRWKCSVRGRRCSRSRPSRWYLLLHFSQSVPHVARRRRRKRRRRMTTTKTTRYRIFSHPVRPCPAQNRRRFWSFRRSKNCSSVESCWWRWRLLWCFSHQRHRFGGVGARCARRREQYPAKTFNPPRRHFVVVLVVCKEEPLLRE